MQHDGNGNDPAIRGRIDESFEDPCGALDRKVFGVGCFGHGLPRCWPARVQVL
jgi:hypothetical protein